MKRYRLYDEEYSIATTITIGDEGCRVVTRHAGHLVCDMPINRQMALHAVGKYGYVEIPER